MTTERDAELAEAHRLLAMATNFEAGPPFPGGSTEALWPPFANQQHREFDYTVEIDRDNLGGAWFVEYAAHVLTSDGQWVFVGGGCEGDDGEVFDAR